MDDNGKNNDIVRRISELLQIIGRWDTIMIMFQATKYLSSSL